MNDGRFLEWVLFAPTTSAATLHRWLSEATQGEAESAEVELVEGARYSALLCYDEGLEQEDGDIARAIREWVDDDVHVVALQRSDDQHVVYRRGASRDEVLMGERAAYALSEELGCPLSVWLPREGREIFQVLLIAGVGMAEFRETAGDSYRDLFTPIELHQVSGGVLIRPVYTRDAGGREMKVSGESVPSMLSATELFPSRLVVMIAAKADWTVFDYVAEMGRREVGRFSVPAYEADEDEVEDEYPRLAAV
ncbi:MAG: hypothetical protein KC731_29085, partial [Myxococcales bacterium]|nr:hypothetical protein [Myxococcales bacterium]